MAAVDEKKNDKPAEEKASEEVFQWVTFKLENEVYGVNVMQVQEVLRYTEIAPVPGAPDYVLGIINLRGNVVTVIDTRLKFGLMPAEITDNSRIIIIDIVKIITVFCWIKVYTIRKYVLSTIYANLASFKQFL